MIKYAYELNQENTFTIKYSCYNYRQFIQIDNIQAQKFVQTDASFRTEKFEQNHDKCCQFHKAINGF